MEEVLIMGLVVRHLGFELKTSRKEKKMEKSTKRQKNEIIRLQLAMDPDPNPKDPNEDDELGSGFTESKSDFDVICNLVFVLPAEYDMISEVDDSEEEEWIHGIGVVPSSMHQRISIWRDDGIVENIDIVENIEADQSYFLAKVNQITRKTFDKNLANIAPCSSAKSDDANQTYASSMKLHPTHGFMWKRETFYT
ncbi:hypothetical protein MTR_1g016990 [Medicago truncatula]|uniref:Uncharacterized protein n=1 Tax=Medicago truncatula TaxID=3880 RepID=A0A072VPB5_MEDTR|nr:hypothetical protein MTR_1g016990 [Medicago truncatula]